MAAPDNLMDRRPSPFVADALPEVGGGQAPAGGSAAASAATQEDALAWEEAWEEAAEAPLIAAAFSSNLSSYCISHQRISLEPAEAQGLKAGEVACGWPAWRAEAGRLLSLGIPISLTNILGFFTSAVGVSFVGRLGGLQLSAAVLAQSVFNVTGLSAMMGFTGTVDTLCGQAVGAGNRRVVGVVLQRALLVNLLFGAAIAVAWLKSEGLFLALGQDQELSAVAARYMRLVAPALPCMGITEACKRWLLAQGVVRPGTVVTAITAALSPLYNWLLIIRLGLGLDGAALAVLALQLTSMLLLGGYVAAHNASLRGQEQAMWHGWSWEAVHGWKQYLSLALPSVLMICCKWWASEALLLMAGWFADAQNAVATMGVLSITATSTFTLFFGLSMAGSIRVGNSLGAGCPCTARRATFATLGLTMVLMAVLISALLTLKARWVRLLTDVEPVVQATVQLLPVFAMSLLGDGANTSLMGLLRGAGKQKVGALTNVVSYWLLAVPLAYHLAFPLGWGLSGLWAGAAIANLAQAGIMLCLALRFDYVGEAARAAARFALRQPLLPSGEAHA